MPSPSTRSGSSTSRANHTPVRSRIISHYWRANEYAVIRSIGGCAGLYIPMLADRILNNTAESKAHGVNIQGFMIGNGCPGWDVLTCASQAHPSLLLGEFTESCNLHPLVVQAHRTRAATPAGSAPAAGQRSRSTFASGTRSHRSPPTQTTWQCVAISDGTIRAPAASTP